MQMSNWQIIVALGERFGMFLLYVLVLGIGIFLLWCAIEFVASKRKWNKTKSKLDRLFEADLMEMDAALDRLYRDAMKAHPSNQVYDWEQNEKEVG